VFQWAYAHRTPRGERNYVTVAREGDLVSIRDTAGIQPGNACEALDPVSARCDFALPTFQHSATSSSATKPIVPHL
jgi:hypothetical protein